MPPHPEGQESRVWPVVAALVPLIAIALGGATAPWSQAVIMILVGICVLVRPPQFFPGWITNSALGALFALALLSFILPATGAESWRAQLGSYFDDILPSRGVPEPWLTLDAVALFALGLVWFYWCVGLRLTSGSRELAISVYTIGLSVIAVGCLILQFRGEQVPFWHHTGAFGPFPNRNQSGNVFGLGGLLAFACAGRALARKTWLKMAMFVVALIPLVAAEFCTLSRLGFTVFGLGVVLWLLYAAASNRSLKVGALGVSAMLAGIAFFGLSDTRISERFKEADLTSESPLGFRAAVYKDALRFIADAPLFGHGLATFEPLFALGRQASRSDSRISHPESDWFWVGSELGIIGCLALVMAIAGSGSVLAEMFRRGRLLDGACLSYVAMFVLHSLLDVPGHRLGSVMPALLMIGVILGQSSGRWTPLKLPAFAFQVAAFGLMTIGSGWLAMIQGRIEIPGTIAARKAVSLSEWAIKSRQWNEARDAADWGLQSSPLSWQLHQNRGRAAIANRDWLAGLADFERAKRLQPRRVELRMQQGTALARLQPMLALPPWREVIALQPPDLRQWFGQMIVQAQTDPRTLAELKAMTIGSPALEVTYLTAVSKEEFERTLVELRSSDADLASWGSSDLEPLLRTWVRHENLGVVLREASSRKAWQAILWREIAAQAAQEGNYETAYETAMEHVDRPEAPDMKLSANYIELAQRVTASPDDFAAAIQLIRHYQKSGDHRLALRVGQKVCTVRDVPVYLRIVAAEEAAAVESWKEAWDLIAPIAQAR